MNRHELREMLRRHGIEASDVHIEATAATVSALLKATAERFAQLPLEAEPCAFAAEQRRVAP